MGHRVLNDRQINRQRHKFTHFLMLMVWVSFLLNSGRVVQAATPTSGPVIVRPGGAQLYDAPAGEVVATLPTSTVFTAVGRTEDLLWVVGQAQDGPPGWLQVTQVIAVGIEWLPVQSETPAEPIVPPANPTESGSVPEGTTALSEPLVMPDVDGPAITNTTTVTGTVASGDDRLNVRSGPGTTYAIVAKAMAGETYQVVGRSTDGTWLQIRRGDDETGWVSAPYLQIEGDVTRLPTVAASAPPPTAIPIASTQSTAPTAAAVSDLGGTLVIESSPGGMIYGYSLASGALWPLSNGFDPALSPEGQTVTFVRDGGENGIYLIDIDGSHERLIFSGRARLSSPKWSPDGQWILFTRSDDSYQCYELGGSCVTLGRRPDGGSLTIPGVEPTTRYWYNLARVDRDGNNYGDIASLTTARAADWNEAGIVYQSDAGLQITADTPDAENRLVIFDYLKPFYDDPDWQPQGGRIVYMGKEASHWELFSVNPDGSGKTALTRPATTIVDVIPSNVAPAWSPDGQHIAFLSNREQSGEAGAWRVWVMDADGSNQRPLNIDLEINYTFGGEQSISWTP